MRHESIVPYIELLRAFVAGLIDAPTFERDYLHLFKSEKTIFPAEVFQVLDALFADIDAFCADAELRDEEDLSEEELRERSTHALERLTALVGCGGSQ